MTGLTELTLRQLKPPAVGQITLWDTVPGFGIRVSSGGAKSFIVLLGSGRRHTIGRYPIISLADARAEAKRVLAERTLGRHQQKTITFEDAIPLFLDCQYQAKRERSRKDSERLLTRHFLPKFRRDKLQNIRAHQIAEILDGLAKTPSEQRHALTGLGTFFRWAVAREYVSANPCAGIKFAKRPGRTRVLSDEELVALWRATEAPTDFNKIVRLLILTGQRRTEIGHLKGEYLNRKGRKITLPGEAVKNGRTHTFPVGSQAWEILSVLPLSGNLFHGASGRVLSQWAQEKALLDKACPLKHWTLHDLRRTFATNLAALSAPPHVVEKLLNHSSGIISGIAAIYNKFQYMDEMTVAIDAWDARLREIIAAADKAELLQRSAA